MLIKVGQKIKFGALAMLLAANNAFAALPGIAQMIQQAVNGAAGSIATLGLVAWAVLEIIELVQGILKGGGNIVQSVIKIVLILLFAYYWKDILMTIAEFAATSRLGG